MKSFLAVLLVIGFAGSAFAGRRGGGYSMPRTYGGYGTGSNPSSTRVDGYSRRNGTYVAPAQRTSPNSTQRDNYNTQGNYNPYNGKTGTKAAQK